MDSLPKPPEFIAGHRVPKWSLPDEDLGIVIDNIKNHSEFDNKLRLIEAERAKRESVGACNRCRTKPCLCNEGQ